MARVVRRSSPPYPLVISILFFFIATALAAVFYLKWTKERDAYTQYRSSNVQLDTNMKEVRGERADLIRQITGKGESATVTAKVAVESGDVALAEADRVFNFDTAHSTSNEGMAAAIASLCRLAETNKKQLDDQRQELIANNALVAEKDRQIAKTENARKDDLAAKITELQNAQENFDRQLGAKNKTWQDEMAKQAALTAEKDKQLLALSKEMEAKNADLSGKDKTIAKLETDVRNLKGTPNLGEVAMRLSDGKIAKALRDQGVVYINIGRQEQVTPGLPFAVFPATGIPADGKPKAKIIVTSVGPNVSEAKIVEEAKDEVITENDLISNLVYNPHRQMNFVVEGEFDLYNQGRPDADGVKRVKGLIQSFGGKVTDEMSLTTDYLVVGAEPPRPPKPADDANAATMQMYNEQVKKYDQYKALMDQARALQVPVLNTNRFLALTGYVPPKRFTQ